MATEGTPISPLSAKEAAAPSSVIPSPLALLTATALGGFLGARAGSKALAVAAGAATLACLKACRRTGAAPAAASAETAPPPLSNPPPPAEPAAMASQPREVAAVDPLIQEWLARQIEREKEAEEAESLRLPPAEPAPGPAHQATEPIYPPAAVLEFAPSPAVPAETPSADISATTAPTDAGGDDDDDYRPEPLMLDLPAAGHAWEAESFATLTEPVPAPNPVVPAVSAPAFSPSPVAAAPSFTPEAGPFFEAAVEETRAPTPPTAPLSPASFLAPPVDLPPALAAAPMAQPQPEMPPRPVFSGFHAMQPPAPPAAAAESNPAPAPFFATPPSAASIPGIEPLPSWQEPSAMQGEPAGVSVPDLDLEELFHSVFRGSPVPAADPATEKLNLAAATAAPLPVVPPPPPGAFPPPPETSQDPMAAFFKMPTPMAGTMGSQPPESTTPPPEIPVHVAAAGEAWFDPPLAETANPWLPPKVAEDDALFAPALATPVVPTSPSAPVPPPAPPPPPPVPVVEAEVVLRPRAPVQAAVIPKNLPAALKPPLIDQDPEPQPSADVPPPPAPAPAPAPREQRSRSSWRSWWRGD